jgi:hypothetical protein
LVKIEQQNGHLGEEFMLNLIGRCKKDEERRDISSQQTF